MKLRAFARWLGVLLVILAAAFLILVLFRIPVVMQKRASAEAVEYIKAQRLTLADVDGSNLPPKPDPALVDATVEGVDANDNGIRDDLELAIFAKYPNSPYTRAAELQYALARSLYLTHAFDEKTWAAVAEQNERAGRCLSALRVGFAETKRLSGEVEALILNTELRKEIYERAFAFTVTHSGGAAPYCDVEL